MPYDCSEREHPETARRARGRLAVNNHGQPERMSAVARLVRVFLKSRIRGKTRLTLFIARRFRSLQCVPVRTQEGAVLFLDLRIFSSHALVDGTTWEKGEQEVMRRLVCPGDVVLDVGAHLGIHTLLLSKVVGESGRVFAFEPNPEVVSVLALTLKPLVNAALFPIALSDRAGSATLYVPADASMGSFRREWTEQEVREVPCNVRTLDALLAEAVIPRPDFIKCDVEGSELAVFEGAHRILNRVEAPVVLFEVRRMSEQVHRPCVDSAFSFLAHLPAPKFVFFGVEGRKLVRRYSPSPSLNLCNIVAVPLARIHRWPELRGAEHVRLLDG